MKLPVFIALLPVIGWFATASAEQTPATFPFGPAQLLQVLPATPEGWKLLRSDAGTTLGEWLETRATRGFQAPPTPDAAVPAGAAIPPPGEIEITVVDTAGFAPALAAFADFTPARKGNLEKKLLGSLPTIVITGEDGRQYTQVLVASRYLVDITLTNLPNQRAEDWLRAFRFNALPPADNTPSARPREFRLSYLDELHPKKNRSYTVSTTSSRRVDAFLKTLPPSEPEESPAAETTSARQP